MPTGIRSIFETFRVGAGPSSSHSIGPQRATRLFLSRQPAPPARLRVTLLGSLAATGRGHLTDRTIADFGGWTRAQAEHFADGGVFDQIYSPS